MEHVLAFILYTIAELASSDSTIQKSLPSEADLIKKEKTLDFIIDRTTLCKHIQSLEKNNDLRKYTGSKKDVPF